MVASAPRSFWPRGSAAWTVSRRRAGNDQREIPGIGPKIAESIARFFQEERNRKTIRHLREAGLDLTEKGVSDTPGPLTGKTLVLTGGLRGLTRDEAKDAVLRLGGRVAGTVSRKTDYVVVGEDAGSKAEDAKRLGVTMLDEARFLRSSDDPRESARPGSGPRAPHADRHAGGGRPEQPRPRASRHSAILRSPSFARGALATSGADRAG